MCILSEWIALGFATPPDGSELAFWFLGFTRITLLWVWLHYWNFQLVYFSSLCFGDAICRHIFWSTFYQLIGSLWIPLSFFVHSRHGESSKYIQTRFFGKAQLILFHCNMHMHGRKYCNRFDSWSSVTKRSELEIRYGCRFLGFLLYIWPDQLNLMIYIFRWMSQDHVNCLVPSHI